MMKFHIEDSGPTIGLKDIHHLESVIGNRLPEEYQSFLLEHNGGHPELECFKSKFDERFEDGFVHYFYGIGEDAPHAQILDVFRIYEGRLPSGLLAIADDPMGNAICISLNQADYGTIFFWDHDKECTPPSYLNVTKLATSLNEFLDGLYEYVRIGETTVERAIRTDDIEKVRALMSADADLEFKNEDGRTMMEYAAMCNAVQSIGYLFSIGASLGNALSIAEKNLKFFPTHQLSVDLLRRLNGPVN